MRESNDVDVDEDGKGDRKYLHVPLVTTPSCTPDFPSFSPLTPSIQVWIVVKGRLEEV